MKRKAALAHHAKNILPQPKTLISPIPRHPGGIFSATEFRYPRLQFPTCAVGDSATTVDPPKRTPCNIYSSLQLLPLRSRLSNSVQLMLVTIMIGVDCLPPVISKRLLGCEINAQTLCGGASQPPGEQPKILVYMGRLIPTQRAGANAPMNAPMNARGNPAANRYSLLSPSGTRKRLPAWTSPKERVVVASLSIPNSVLFTRSSLAYAEISNKY
ncbi:hypothetical protein BD779DRAFT_1474001 [Infundibulicybe gibba]|nr:hypothetical protein BD779DRAFT_1474001 [Infundibulicybe gibba]